MKRLRLLLITAFIFSGFILSSVASATPPPLTPLAPLAPQIPLTPLEPLEKPEIIIKDIVIPTNPFRKAKEFTVIHKLPNHNTPRAQVDSCDPDSSDATGFGDAGWQLNSNTVFRVNLSSAPSTIRSNLNSIVANSFGVWDSQTAQVSFSQGATTSVSRSRLDYQNVLAWGRLAANTLGLTTIRYFVDTGEVVDVDTIMNSRVTWTWTNPTTLVAPATSDNTCGDLTKYDAQDILTHEIGHWMGLDDIYSSSNKDLTMYGYGRKGELKKNTLEPGDILGIQVLYP